MSYSLNFNHELKLKLRAVKTGLARRASPSRLTKKEGWTLNCMVRPVSTALLKLQDYTIFDEESGRQLSPHHKSTYYHKHPVSEIAYEVNGLSIN